MIPTPKVPPSIHPCEAHATAKRKDCPTHAQYNELHHVIPQAWQLFWTPKMDAIQKMGHAASGLFDARTAALCPTAHRNVHFWLVRIMGAMPARVFDPEPMSGGVALANAENRARMEAHAEGRPFNRREWAISRQAVVRWVATGGSIGDLIRAGQKGEA